MEFSNNQKAFLWILLLVLLVVSTVFKQYPTHPDHYALGQYTQAVIDQGYAPWVLHPLSLFGYYPLAIPSGFEFFFAMLYHLTGLELPILIILFSTMSGVFAVVGVYLVVRHFWSFEQSFLTAFIMSSIVLFIKNVSNTASSRMFNIIFYPLFIFLLFKIVQHAIQHKKIHKSYTFSIVLLFILMNLIHRFGQLLIIFILAAVLALIMFKLPPLLQWLRKTPLLAFRNPEYKRSPLLLLLDLEVGLLAIATFFWFKLSILWLSFVLLTAVYYVMYDYPQFSGKQRSEPLILLDMALFPAFWAVGKAIDLVVRGRLTANVVNLYNTYSFQLIMVGSLALILLVLLVVIIVKYFKNIGKLVNVTRTWLIRLLKTKPELAVSYLLLLGFFFLLSRNFTGTNFYRFGLDHYISSYFFTGTSPWIIMINFIFNLNNNVSILIYFAIIGVIYVFLKHHKTYYDYFFMFVALGFSQFLLDWEYIRLYILPIYAIFMAMGLVFTFQVVKSRISRRVAVIGLVSVLILSIIVGNFFIHRLTTLPLLGIEEESDHPIHEEYYIKIGSYLSDKGDISVHSATGTNDQTRVAYYAGVPEAALAQSIKTEAFEDDVEAISADEIIETFKQGKKVTQIYQLKDPVLEGDYYFGRHIYNLNKLSISEPQALQIIDIYDISYLVNYPQEEAKTRLFQSLEGQHNKVYSSSELELYEVEGAYTS